MGKAPVEGFFLAKRILKNPLRHVRKRRLTPNRGGRGGKGREFVLSSDVSRFQPPQKTQSKYRIQGQLLTLGKHFSESSFDYVL